jgi:hypothetical protein
MEKLIYTNSICPRRDDVGALRSLAAETMKKGLISRTPGIQIGSDLLLRASGAKKIVSRPVESGKVQLSHLGKLTVYKVYADGIDLGYQVSETDVDGKETLVGERVRTLEAGKAFAKDQNDPAGNQFVALWTSPRIEMATRRLRIQRRSEDRVWAPAIGAALVSKAQPRGYVDIADLPKTEDEICEEEACALLENVATPEALGTMRLLELRRMADALGARPKQGLAKEDFIAVILPRIRAALNTGRAPVGVIDALRVFSSQGVEEGVA